MAKEEKSMKRKTSAITQEEVSTLLLRYPVKTVLTLLHEVAKVAQEKIDWNEIVKNTATGISSARECQMLWRHLAYGESLTDQFDYAANPMDDDSDLENEMQAFPAVNREASVEASAYVKVLNASNYPIDSHVPNNWTVEAPLTINILKFKVPADSSLPANAMQGTNVSIHVSVEREKLLSRPCGEKRPNDGKSGDGFASQRKRKVLSTEDDVKLTAALEKHGEQNWAINASEEFNNDRKASELSQRCPSIRKKMGNLIAGTSSGLSEAQKAASRAILIALEPERLKAVPQMGNAYGVANPVKLDEVSAKASEIRTLAVGEIELISECHTTPIGNQSKQKVDEHQNSASCNRLGGNTQGDRASISHSDPTNQTQGQGVQQCWEVEDNGKTHADGVTIGEVIHEETTEIAGVEEIK